jgi:hypothetical protein
MFCSYARIAAEGKRKRARSSEGMISDMFLLASVYLCILQRKLCFTMRRFSEPLLRQ